MKAAFVTVGAVLVAAAALAGTDDEVVRQRIEERLARAGLDKRAHIEVSVAQGVARLDGTAVVYGDSRDAARAARKEARSVVNEIRVVPDSRRKDADLGDEARDVVLGWERYGMFDAVGVDAKDGVLILNGWVDSPYKKDEIEDRLARLEGLRDVHNDLRVQGFSAGDQRLLREIHQRIYRDPMFERWASSTDPPVRVYVDRGRVILAGLVTSPVERLTAGAIARSTLAFSVSNQVLVEGDRRGAEPGKDGSS